mgnify:CR=1 FL=1
MICEVIGYESDQFVEGMWTLEGNRFYWSSSEGPTDGTAYFVYTNNCSSSYEINNGDNINTSLKNVLANCIKAVNRFFISIQKTLISILAYLKKALPTLFPKAVSVKAVGSSELHRPNAKRAATESTYSHTTPTKSLKV